MKKAIYLLFALFFVMGGAQLFAQQQIQTKVSDLSTPIIVNFSERAEYQKLHPSRKQQKFIEQGEDREEKVKFTPKPVLAGSPVFNVELPKSKSPGIAAVSPPPKVKFNGTMDNGTLIPPDVQGAAGPVYLMQSTNQQIDIRSKTGTLISAVDPASLFGSAGSGFFDPHVYYDPNYGRYLICIAGNLPNNNSAIFVAVSVTSDPTGYWYMFSHDGTGNTTDFLDFPLMGYNTNWLVVTGNIYSGNNVYSKICVFNRASIYSGSGGTVTDFTDNNAFSICPAQTQDITQAKEYLISDYDGNSGGNGYMEIGTISGAVNSPVYTAVSTIGINRPWNENSVGAAQLGSTQTLEEGDTRIGGGAVYINGSLWFSHTVFLPVTNPTRDAVDWWQIDPATPAVQQFGRLEDATGAIDYFYPSISVNSLGDALLGYCESGTSMYPSVSYSFHANTDAAGIMEDTYIAKSGVASYYKTMGGGRNRYGDFTFTAVDPTDNSFWNFSEWANTGSNWATYISNIAGSNSPVCLVASGLTTTAITDKAATFTWSSISNAASYTIRYRQVGTTTWTTVNNLTSTSYSVSGLTGSTNYEWQVQTNCLVGGTSAFSASATFLTLFTCNVTAPTAGPVTICSGNQAVLNATGSDSLYWYTVSSGGTVVGTGRTYMTPALTANKTYYVESDVYPPVQHLGPANNSIGLGDIFTNGAYYHDLIFDCFSPVRLLSVLVYAQGTSSRTITLKDQLGNTLQQATFNIPDGTSRLSLNFNIPIGTNLELGMQGNVALFRNSAGAVFPYSITNVISIKGTNATTAGYYYYFYDWQIIGTVCKSARIPVSVNVLNPVAAFGYSIFMDSVAFDDQSSGATSWQWNFGDNTTSTAQNPSHNYSSSRTFNVRQIVCSGSCCDTVSYPVTISITGVMPVSDHSIIVYPNPFKENVLITFSSVIENGSLLKVVNAIGEVIIQKSLSPSDISEGYILNTSPFAQGIYTLIVENEHSRFIKKIIKE